MSTNLVAPDPAVGPESFGRYGQLTYTSFDAGGVGGWQVKQQVGLSDDETAALRARITTQFDAGYELPRFPAPEEIAAFPRRLVYAPVTSSTAWWHTTPAGSDASGRPGNIFAHVILDRSPAEITAFRPIDLWRSPVWLTPFGADAVVQADLPIDAKPVPGSVVDADAVINFLLDLTHFRLGTLGALLDACGAAICGGPRVVLATESVDSAALWIGALSYLMAAPYARCAFFFSTLERSLGVNAAFGNGAHVVCVPRADAEKFSARDGYVVLEEGEPVQIGDLGGQPHRTSRGYEIAATEWSAIAQVMLLDQATARLALDRMDALTCGLPEVGSEPAWGLALVVTTDRSAFSDAVGEAARVLARSSPVSLPEGLVADVSALLDGQLGSSTETAWRFLESVVGSGTHAGLVPSVLLGLYAKRAAADVSWLTRPEGVPPLPRLELPAAASAEVTQVAMTTIGRLRQVEDLDHVDDQDRAITVARLTNFLAPLDLHDHTLNDTLADLLEECFIYRLFGPDAPMLVERVGPFDEVTQRTFIRPPVENNSAMHTAEVPGHRLPREVLLWLYPTPPQPVRLEPSLSLDDLQLPAELAAQLISWRPDSPTYVEHRPLALWASLAAADSEQYFPDLASYFAGPPWDARDLFLIERRFPGRLPVQLLAPTLKGAVSSAPLTELCKALRLRQLDEGPAMDVAPMRYAFETERWYGLTNHRFAEVLGTIMRGGSYASLLVAHPFDPTVLDALRVAAIMSAVLGRHEGELTTIRPALGEARRLLTNDEREMVIEALTNNTSRAEVALSAMAADPRFPESSFQHPRYVWLDGMSVVEGDSPVPVLTYYLLRRFAEYPPYAHTLADEVLDLVWDRIAQHRDAEKALRPIEKFVRGWLKTTQNREWRQDRWKAHS